MHDICATKIHKENEYRQSLRKNFLGQQCNIVKCLFAKITNNNWERKIIRKMIRKNQEKQSKLRKKEKEKAGSIQLYRPPYSPIFATRDHYLLPKLKKILSHEDLWFQSGSTKSSKDIQEKNPNSTDIF
jgi:hypothetical protein